MLATETGFRKTGAHKIVVELGNEVGSKGSYGKLTGFHPLRQGNRSATNPTVCGKRLGIRGLDDWILQKYTKFPIDTF